ncbi:hypothetical protein Tco_0823622 [Tanacetum coccineum]|uniref:DUF4216 domain-containing protein n=1 Tax=Tanacetum coccineum TaxID=301880 RepID=A0ABQ5AJD9_9ASTR
MWIPPPTCQFQVFRSLCKSIGLRSVIRFDAQELKKVIWYVLHNSPEIDTYRSQFKRTSLERNRQRWWSIYYLESYERRTTQNSVICSPGPDGEMYYGQLQEILEFKYLLFKVVLFRVKWFDTSNQGRKVKRLVLRNNMTQIDTRAEAFKDDQYILDDPDIIHFDNSSGLSLSTNDDITDDEDTLPYDLADSDDEDLINVDDDGVDKVYSSEEED